MKAYMLMMAANAATYCASIVLIVSTMIRAGKKRLLLAYLTLTAVMMALTPVIAHTWIIPPVLLTLFLRGRVLRVKEALFYSLSAVFIIWVIDATTASFIMYFATDWHGGIGFNYLMCAVNLLAAAVFLKVPALARAFAKVRPNGWTIVLKLSVILYFSVILPRNYSDMTGTAKQQVAVLTVPLMLLTLAVWLLTKSATRLEDDIDERKRKEAIHREYAEIINERFRSANIQRHYSLRMFQTISSFIKVGDMDGLAVYFNQYVAPLGGEIRGKRLEDLWYISNELIRNLIDSAMEEAHASLPHIAAECSVSGVVALPRHMEMDLFKILSIYIGNAFEELQELPEGAFKIQARGDAETISIVVANTVAQGFSIRHLQRLPLKWEEHGYGLNHVRELSLQYPNMRTSSFLTEHAEQRHLNQRIEIAI